jgi:hypothetical protein
MMLIPAMAFAWCVVSLPRSPDPVGPIRVAHSSAAVGSTSAQDPGSAETQPVDADADADDDTDEHASPPAEGRPYERTPIRGPLPLAVIAFARTLVNLPMGTEQVAEIDGQQYVFVLERHYHPPGFVGAPVGWHKGVTAFALQ